MTRPLPAPLFWAAVTAWLTLASWVCGDVLQYTSLRAGWWVVTATVRREWITSLPTIP
jgi:purine-cytosine permease-like protein